MIRNCEFCGKPISEVGRLKNVRDWETETCFGDSRKKARVRHLCKTCSKLFSYQSGTSITIKEEEKCADL